MSKPIEKPYTCEACRCGEYVQALEKRASEAQEQYLRTLKLYYQACQIPVAPSARSLAYKPSPTHIDGLWQSPLGYHVQRADNTLSEPTSFEIALEQLYIWDQILLEDLLAAAKDESVLLKELEHLLMDVSDFIIAGGKTNG